VVFTRRKERGASPRRYLKGQAQQTFCEHSLWTTAVWNLF
jgi:hypothetical protein